MNSESDNFKSNLVALFSKPCIINDTQIIGTIVGFFCLSDSPHDIIVKVKANDGNTYDIEYDRIKVLRFFSIGDFIKSPEDIYKQCDNFVMVSDQIARDLFNKYPDMDFMVLSHEGLRINGVSHSSPFPPLPEEVIRIEINKGTHPDSFKFFLKDREIIYKWQNYEY